jgi:hypothetical protein
MSLLGTLVKKSLSFIPGVSQLVTAGEMIGAVAGAVKKIPAKGVSPQKLITTTSLMKPPLISKNKIPPGTVEKLNFSNKPLSAGARAGSLAARGLNALGTIGTTVYLGDLAIQAVTHGRNNQTVAGLPQTVDQSLLRPYYRAPKGYVVVKDQATGKYIGVLKADARRLGLWRPKPKPPISVADWHAYKGAIRTEKKIKKVFSHSFRGHRSAGHCAPVHHKKKGC